MKHLALILALLLCGCTSPKPAVKAEPVILNWSEKTIPMSSAKAWAKQAEKRLGTSAFTLLVCHGVTIDGAWTLVPDPPRKSLKVDDVGWVLRNINNLPLVVVSCNEGAHKLTVPNAIYPQRIVWSCPDANTPLWPLRRQDYIGKIELFSSTQPVKLAGER
jgi:hypothetical protein